MWMNWRASLLASALAVILQTAVSPASHGQASGAEWTFAVSGDSRNCGDFVMPAIAAGVKTEKDAFYWHLGDFRVMSKEADQDMEAMRPGKPYSTEEYQKVAWDDFLEHQMAAFGTFRVFLGRGNHETHPP